MTTFTLYWIRQDGQGDFNVGTFPTKAEAEAAIPAAKAELIDQCGEASQRQEIEDGSWNIQANETERASECVVYDTQDSSWYRDGMTKAEATALCLERNSANSRDGGRYAITTAEDFEEVRKAAGV